VGGPGIQIRVAGGEFGITTHAWLTDHKVFVPGERFTDGTITIDVTGPGQVHIRQSGSFIPPPSPSGYFISDAQLATLISTWRAVTVPTITQQQFDTVQGILNAIAGVTPGAPNSTVRVPPASSLTAPDGAVWTLSGNVVLRNGTNTGGKGSVIALDVSIVKVLGTDGGWWAYSNGSWQRTSAPL
jgi:hypothetical protein